MYIHASKNELGQHHLPDDSIQYGRLDSLHSLQAAQIESTQNNHERGSAHGRSLKTPQPADRAASGTGALLAEPGTARPTRPGRLRCLVHSAWARWPVRVASAASHSLNPSSPFMAGPTGCGEDDGHVAVVIRTPAPAPPASAQRAAGRADGKIGGGRKRGGGLGTGGGVVRTLEVRIYGPPWRYAFERTCGRGGRRCAGLTVGGWFRVWVWVWAGAYASLCPPPAPHPPALCAIALALLLCVYAIAHALP